MTEKGVVKSCSDDITTNDINELSKKSQIEDMQVEEYESREESLARIRYLKNLNRELSHFNKLFTKTFNL